MYKKRSKTIKICQKWPKTVKKRSKMVNTAKKVFSKWSKTVKNGQQISQMANKVKSDHNGKKIEGKRSKQ